jgi:hypothetical protein
VTVADLFWKLSCGCIIIKPHDVSWGIPEAVQVLCIYPCDDNREGSFSFHWRTAGQAQVCNGGPLTEEHTEELRSQLAGLIADGHNLHTIKCFLK